MWDHNLSELKDQRQDHWFGYECKNQLKITDLEHQSNSAAVTGPERRIVTF
jgi:hypothetical protein